jgi:4-amino-4-deoxy-L-arabinose transferase-like glycosyltransferase
LPEPITKGSPKLVLLFFRPDLSRLVNHPTPAIVAQSAVRRFPRWALLLFCIAYVLPGFFGRDAWKSADMTSMGFMSELARGTSHWMSPTLLGAAPESPALLPYWLGAWAISLAPVGLPADFVVRVPFGLLLALALVATWYGTYYLARSPLAQPVAFAFGGEAQPTDYARAMADGGVLAFIACLGLAQLSHETTPALAQLGCTALLFFAFGALPYRRPTSVLAMLLGLAGLTLSGAPMLATLYGLGGAGIHFLDRSTNQTSQTAEVHTIIETILILAGTVLVAVLAWKLNLWAWKIELPQATWKDWNGILQLLLWFTWPAWPLVLWTVWRWRHQLLSRHIHRHVALPAWFVCVTLLATLSTGASDRTLLLSLPAMASLAAFALTTLKRQVAALIDWFTLLFFSTCGFIIWVVWIAMQTGMPTQPAANVARLAPGFVASFSAFAFTIAAAATLAWGWLVRWRVGRHRAAIWKSLVLPSAGAALCWLLSMTLWMPLLNYAQSYTTLVHRTLAHMDEPGCVHPLGLSSGQIAAFQVYGELQFKSVEVGSACPWLVTEPGPDLLIPDAVDLARWDLSATVLHPVDDAQSLLVFKRK